MRRQELTTNIDRNMLYIVLIVRGGLDMELEYTYWKAKDGWFVGYLNIWPDHLTQGKDIAELEEMLLDLYEFYKEEQSGMETIEKKTGQLKVYA